LSLETGFLDLFQPCGPDRTHTCLTLSHDHRTRQLFTRPEAAATVAPERGELLEATTHDPSIRPPSLASTAATAWLSPCRWSGWVRPTAGASLHGATRSCGRRGTPPGNAVSCPRPGTAC